MVNDARYETAPAHSAMSAQNNFFNVPPRLSSPTGPTPSGQNGAPGLTMPEPQALVRRDNSLKLRDPGPTTTYHPTRQPSTSKSYQTQPQLSREPSTRQPPPSSFPEPVIPAPTLRHPERAHHHSRSNSDGSKHKHRRERECPAELVQSSTLLPTTATDLGWPLQAAYPVGSRNGGIGRHHRQGSTSNNPDWQGSHRRPRFRPRSTSRTRTGNNPGTLVGCGHSHSRLLSNSVTPTRSRSCSRDENPTGAGSGNGSGGSRLRRSAEHRKARGVKLGIPSYEVNGQPPVGYGSGYELNDNGNGGRNYTSR
jgi:hypothetical protein